MRPLVDEFPLPATCRLGWGEIRYVGEDARRLGGHHALIVTSPGLEDGAAVRETEDRLVSAGLTAIVYGHTSHAPDNTQVKEASAIYAENECDILVSVGGGNPHDLAKAVGVVASHGGTILDFEGEDRLRVSTPPHIAVNTTTGTGSEISRFAFITSHRKGRRLMVSDRRITPRVAINDPALQESASAELTAMGGMNVLTHACEAYLSRKAAPLSDTMALDAIELVAKNLERAVVDPHDHDARAALAHAEQLAGLAYNVAGLGLADAMSMAISSVYDAPQAGCNAVLLPHVLAYESAAEPERVAQIAEVLLGADAPKDTVERARACPAAVEALARRVRTPRSLRHMGIDEEVSYMCVWSVLKSALLASERRPPRDVEIVAMLEAAVEGAPAAIL